MLETIEVDTITLQSFFERERIHAVELLKVDTEGHDLDVVRSAGDDIRRVKRIQLEVQSGPEYYVGASREEPTPNRYPAAFVKFAGFINRAIILQKPNTAFTCTPSGLIMSGNA